MRDGIFYSLAIAAAIALVALALVWPQGLGTTSPAPFGHPMGPPPPPEAPKAAAKPIPAAPPGPAKTEPKLRPQIETTAP